jgi:hypothetical protein
MPPLPEQMASVQPFLDVSAHSVRDSPRNRPPTPPRRPNLYCAARSGGGSPRSPRPTNGRPRVVAALRRPGPVAPTPRAATVPAAALQAPRRFRVAQG